MVSTADNAVPSTFQGHPILGILALIVLGIALLIGILHEITFALEVFSHARGSRERPPPKVVRSCARTLA